MEQNFQTFHEACSFIQNLPYRRNQDKSNLNCVIEDNGGTCSTKHAFLKDFADKNGIENVQLMLGIFKMKGSYNKKLIPVLEKYGLNEMPEAHNYLRINGEIKDFTTNKSSAEDFRNDLVKEIEINPDQITDFKVEYHRNFLKDYLSNNPEIPYSLEEFWTIREACIEALQS